MARNLSLILWLIYTVFPVLCGVSCHRPPAAGVTPEQPSVTAGVYYFDGWTGKTHHITPELSDFPERRPTGGWVTSTVEGMDDQIKMAADAGISFFNFCWYYSPAEQEGNGEEPLNQALRLYLSSGVKNRIRFSVMVANHAGYLVGPEEWPRAIKAWVELFRDRQYLKVGGKPYISFFSLQTLLDKFGSVEKVKWAVNELRQAVWVAGFEGVTIGVCVGSSQKERQMAAACGFDLLTSYNDHTIGFQKGTPAQPISRLIEKSPLVWNKFRDSRLRCIPTVTLGWDMRPWDPEKKSSYYTGYTAASVYASVKAVVDWVNRNKNAVTKEKVVLLYAWNEYGEGAWLTPSLPLKDSLLQGVKKALHH
jgi:hypothetical protein